MVTARGVSAARDGQIHTDSRTKLITVLIYMNNAWEAKTGRLRLLRGPGQSGRCDRRSAARRRHAC